VARGLLVETFYGGSHRAFADGLVRHSRHSFALLTLPGDEWRKRMRRGAIEVAAQLEALPGHFDFVIATDMVDLAAFLAMTRRRLGTTPTLLYMHENQFTYPRLRGTRLNSWYGQMNYLSALAADRVAFNSEFHRRSFLGALETLQHEPNNWLVPGSVVSLDGRSEVLPIGVDLDWIDACRTARPEGPPIILWNHRWEFDKAPEMFVRVLRRLRDEGVAFRLAIAGEPGPNPHPSLAGIPGEFGDRVVHHGYAASRAEYGRILWESSVVVSTTRHEFFGIATVEALRAGCFPVVPNGFNYPALVPTQFHDACLYGNEDECTDLLRERLTAPVGHPETAALQAATARWEWPRVASEWDDALDRLVRQA